MKTVRLGDYATLIRGITYKPTDRCHYLEPNAVACMRTKNIQVELDQSDLVGVPKSLLRGEKKILNQGDILVSSANSWNLVGKCCWVPRLSYEATAGGFISILRPTSQNLIPRFLYQWFSSVRVQTVLRSFGNQTTNISNLNHERCLDLEIPLPSLSEQKRIAGILDAADALRTKRRAALAQLDSLTQSLFLDLFGDPVSNPMEWKVVPLRSVTELENGDRSSNYPSGSDILKSGVLFMSTKNISNSRLKLDVCQFISEKKFKSLSRGKLRRNDLVITLRGTLGSCAIFDCKFETGFINAQILIIHPGDSINNVFLHAFLTTERMKKHLEEISTGVAVKQLTGRQIGDLEIIFPPFSLQQHFAGIVESIERQKTRHRAHLAELDTLFASLQSRAFKGELTEDLDAVESLVS